MYLLDSDIVIFMIRGLHSSQRPLRNKAERIANRCELEGKAGRIIAVSAITVSELEYGARKSEDYDAEILIVNKVLTPFQRLHFDGTACASEYGRIHHDLSRQGLPIGLYDTLIAAHPLAIDATLVTNNTAHYTRVRGLRVENWVKDA